MKHTIKKSKPHRYTHICVCGDMMEHFDQISIQHEQKKSYTQRESTHKKWFGKLKTKQDAPHSIALL